ncbi:MAG: YjgP/YjgQ family permease [Alphaproteobacteria bacterium]|nr:YjgP/YjgQ family permease [Alphaproteobacteria bacterium]
MLRIVDRYVLRQITTPLMAAMSIGLVMLLAERMVRLLDTTLGKKNSFGVVFELLAYLVPHYLGTAIPAALFLGLLFGFSRMSTNSETDAFQAAGVGLSRLTRPVVVLALILAGLSFFVFGWAQPYTRYAYRSVVFDVQNVDFFYLAEEGVFMQSGGRTFILDTLDRSENSFDRAFIYEEKKAQGSETITAAHGRLIPLPTEPRPVLHLENGHRLIFKQKPSTSDQPQLPEINQFGTADTPLGKLSKDIFRPRGDDEREMTLPELIAKRNAPPKGTTSLAMEAEIHKRLMNALSPLVLPFLALPFAVGGKRNQRAYRFGVALVIVVAFHEIIEQGSVAAHAGSASPWLVFWVPLLLLSIFAGWRYYATCYTVNADWLYAQIDRFGDLLSSLQTRFLRKLGFEDRS